MTHVSRRMFLAGSTAMLPFIPLLEDDAHAAGGPTRLVIFWTPNGVQRQSLRPGSPGNLSVAQAPCLEPLSAYEDRMIFLQGVDFAAHFEHLGGNGGDHHPGHSCCMTGTDVDAGPSIDQFIAQRLQAGTPFESIYLGVDADSYASEIFWKGPGERAYPENDPQVAFDALFANVGEGDPQAELELSQRRSVLDVTRERIRALEPKLSAADNLKLQAHLEAISELEGQLHVGSCEAPTLSPGQAFFDVGRRQLEILSNALACDLSRVAVIQWSSGASDVDVLDMGYAHHALAHGEVGLPDAENEGLLTEIGRTYASQLAYLCDRLDAVPEGDGSVLDNTMILWCSEHAATGGAHDRDDMPYVLIGSGGGALQTGRYLAYNGASNNDLYISLAHAMGLADVDVFGTPSLCSGGLSELA